MRKTMIPNHQRANKTQQEFIVKAIDALGYEPFKKPIHLYSLEEYEKIGKMYREVVQYEKMA